MTPAPATASRPGPARGTGRATAASARRHRRPGPRLLLPPVPEPDLRPEVATAVALVPPSHRSVRSPVTELAWPLEPPPATPPPARRLAPEALCRSVVVAAVEVLAGTRPVTQLTRWVSPQVYDALAARVEQPAPGPVRRATARRVRLCAVTADAVEASVVLHDGSRVRAAAVRLERHRDRWRATVLQIG